MDSVLQVCYEMAKQKFLIDNIKNKIKQKKINCEHSYVLTISFDSF